MPEPIANSSNPLPDEPELRRQEREPKGVLQKNLKAAALPRCSIAGDRCGDLQRYQQEDACSEGGKCASAATADAPGQHRQQRAGPQEPGRRSTTEGCATGCEFVALPDPSLAIGTPAQQAAVSPYGPTGQPAPCIPGQPCAQQQSASMQQQLSPAAQEEQQLAAKDRELAYDARFASNLVYARQPDSQAQQQGAVPLEDTGTARVGSAGAYGARAWPDRQLSHRAAGCRRPACHAGSAGPDRAEARGQHRFSYGQPYVIMRERPWTRS